MQIYNYSLDVDPDREGAIREYIAKESEWFHSFTFNGVIHTPGKDPSQKKLHHLGIPGDLTGLDVLDIGAYDGYFSFQMENRGARNVVAADSFVWNWPGSSALKNFRAIHRARKSRVVEVNSSVETLPANLKRQFDIVLFPGVLYHAPDIVGYMRNVFECTKPGGLCIVETYAHALAEPEARWFACAPAEFNNDASNWFAPNLAALYLLAERVGFSNIQFCCMWDLNTTNVMRKEKWATAVTNGRLVFHCYK